MSVNHEAIAENIIELLAEGAGKELIVNYLKLVYNTSKEDVENSWKNNPDRSGGCFTDEEINRTGWY